MCSTSASVTGPASASGTPARSHSTSGASAGDGGRPVGQPGGGAVVDVGVQALGEAAQLGGDAGVAVGAVGGLLAREPAQLLVEQPLARRARRCGRSGGRRPAMPRASRVRSSPLSAAPSAWCGSPIEQRVQRDQELDLRRRHRGGVGDVPGAQDRVVVGRRRSGSCGRRGSGRRVARSGRRDGCEPPSSSLEERSMMYPVAPRARLRASSRLVATVLPDPELPVTSATWVR